MESPLLPAEPIVALDELRSEEALKHPHDMALETVVEVGSREDGTGSILAAHRMPAAAARWSCCPCPAARCVKPPSCSFLHSAPRPLRLCRWWRTSPSLGRSESTCAPFCSWPASSTATRCACVLTVQPFPASKQASLLLFSGPFSRRLQGGRSGARGARGAARRWGRGAWSKWRECTCGQQPGGGLRQRGVCPASRRCLLLRWRPEPRPRPAARGCAAGLPRRAAGAGRVLGGGR